MHGIGFSLFSATHKLCHLSFMICKISRIVPVSTANQLTRQALFLGCFYMLGVIAKQFTGGLPGHCPYDTREKIEAQRGAKKLVTDPISKGKSSSPSLGTQALSLPLKTNPLSCHPHLPADSFWTHFD